MLSPRAVRIDACTACQLKCPLCPTPAANSFLGQGMLPLEDFCAFVDANPQVRTIELGSKGEALLNPQLPAMLDYAQARGVVLELHHGVNFNHAPDQLLDALVRCGTPRLRVSIDGVTQHSYARYRVGGDLGRVLENIRKINALKRRYGVGTPEMTFQFIVFSHNVHEMDKAAVLARLLHMTIHYHLNAFPEVLPAADIARVRRILGYATREEFMSLHGRHYMRHLCYQMWVRPQINWDGRLLGCCKNLSSTYANDVLGPGFVNAFNGEALEQTRRMLQGAAEPSPEHPCASCGLYRTMSQTGNWIQNSEIVDWAAGQLGSSGARS